MSMQPPRPGYHRDGWDENNTPQDAAAQKDPLVVNLPALLGIAVGTIITGGIFVPIIIMLWRAAL